MPTDTSQPEFEFDPRAQELFFAFCERIERGESPDFEALCMAHPDFEGELRELRSLREFARTLAKRPQDDKLHSTLLNPDSVHADDLLTSSSALFERLRGAAPRDTR